MFPLNDSDAIKYFGHILNDFEKQEVAEFSNEIYYLGQNCRKKIKGHLLRKGTDQ